MIKRLEIEGKPVELNSSAGWLYVYRNQFGRDILPDVMPMIESFLTLAIDVMKSNGDGELDIDTMIQFADEDRLDDIFARFAGMETITLLGIFWALAKNANKSIKQPEEFFNDFEILPLDEIIPEVFHLIIESSLSSKNSKSLLDQLTSKKLSQLISTK